MNSKPKVIFIVGPTASGKSSLSIEKALDLDGEIINADSRQIYKDLIVGTSSPCKEDKIKVPHHLYNFVDVAEVFSASKYIELAKQKIDEIISRGKQPIIVGGTGMYLEALVFGYKIPPQDLEIRRKYEQQNTKELYDLLQKKDQEYASKINENSRPYILRALEIIEITGKTRTEVMKERDDLNFEPEVIYQTFDREKLIERIEKRTELIWNDWVNEVRDLMNKYSTFEEPGFTSIGYKEIRDFLLGNISKEETINIINQITAKYAKRQRTWFRKENWKRILSSDTL